MLYVLSFLCGPCIVQNTNARFIKEERKFVVHTQSTSVSESSWWNLFKLIPFPENSVWMRKILSTFIYQPHSPGVKKCNS